MTHGKIWKKNSNFFGRNREPSSWGRATERSGGRTGPSRSLSWRGRQGSQQGGFRGTRRAVIPDGSVSLPSPCLPRWYTTLLLSLSLALSDAPPDLTQLLSRFHDQIAQPPSNSSPRRPKSHFLSYRIEPERSVRILVCSHWMIPPSLAACVPAIFVNSWNP